MRAGRLVHPHRPASGPPVQTLENVSSTGEAAVDVLQAARNPPGSRRRVLGRALV